MVLGDSCRMNALERAQVRHRVIVLVSRPNSALSMSLRDRPFWGPSCSLRGVQRISAGRPQSLASTIMGHKGVWNDYSAFKYSSVPTSIWITLMFVLSLYMWPKHRQRTQRSTVIRRLVSITVSAAISILIVYFYSRYHSNKSWMDLILAFRLRKLKIRDIIWPLIITATIFLGPIIDDVIGSRWTLQSWRRRPDLLTIVKNLFLAPLIEEIVFRCINCTLLSNDLSFGTSVIISGLLFGAAHMHPQIMQHIFMDMERELLLHSIMGFLYTSAFGMYVAAIFMRTQSLWPPTLVHIFCNFMGLPSSDIWRTRWTSMVTTSGLVGGLLLYTNYIMAVDS